MSYIEGSTAVPSVTSSATGSNSPNGRVKVELYGSNLGFEDLTVTEVNLAESLLTPGLQTSFVCHSFVYARNDLDRFKNQSITLNLHNEFTRLTVTNHKIYRLDSRALFNSVSSLQQFVVHACDNSLLKDASLLVSKSWGCATPADVVNDMLGTKCIGATSPDVQSDSGPGRDYLADNIHPFQVIAQQANVAIDGDDPSFVHYMTYENQGTHHFKSLSSMCNEVPQVTFEYAETGLAGLKDYNHAFSGNRRPAIAFSFPCDFDLLSDVLNGISTTGQNINVLASFSPLTGDMSSFGSMLQGTCREGANYKSSITNSGTAKQQQSCPTNVEQYLLKRQARMGLLERDKVALRIIVPWCPDIHAGHLINFIIPDKRGKGMNQIYGSGTYLVASLIHKITLGGFSTTTLDCVANTVGQGQV